MLDLQGKSILSNPSIFVSLSRLQKNSDWNAY